MLACVDVDYREDHDPPFAVAAGVVFDDWASDQAVAEHVQKISEIAPYVPGQLYRRELPCVLAVLDRITQPLDAIVVDGYAFLDAQDRPGLGAHLHAALDGKIPVVGVAKNYFRGSAAVEIHRGGSSRPLFVTAVGLSTEQAARGITQMHGPHRLPTLLKRVDRLCRDAWR